jgi:excisionase family DNA binding protein
VFHPQIVHDDTEKCMRNEIGSQPLNNESENESLARPVLANRLTCTVREACNATGIGKTTMHAMISGGAVASTKVGRRRLIKVPSLLQLLGHVTASAAQELR